MLMCFVVLDSDTRILCMTSELDVACNVAKNCEQRGSKGVHVEFFTDALLKG